MRLWLAEFTGTFALLFAGIGTLAAGMSALGVALAFGLAVAVMIAAVGAISYAHFNPAVTLGFLLMGRISLKQLWLYWSAELAGALAAMAALESLFGSPRLQAVQHGTTLLADNLSIGAAFALETLLSFFLMFVIASCVLQNHALAGLYIGAVVTLGALVGSSLTGASMNPARSFAPALFANIWMHHWLYWLAPCLGASVAALLASYLWQPLKIRKRL